MFAKGFIYIHIPIHKHYNPYIIAYNNHNKSCR